MAWVGVSGDLGAAGVATLGALIYLLEPNPRTRYPIGENKKRRINPNNPLLPKDLASSREVIKRITMFTNGMKRRRIHHPGFLII